MERFVEATRTSRALRGTPVRLRETLNRFRREEDGSLIVFGLFCFVTMLFVAGFALDMMRYESERAILQNTMDRALLAAADIDQQLDSEAVVRDYFDRAGFDGSEVNAVGTHSGGMKTVTADAATRMDTFLLHLVDIPVLYAPAGGTAQEGNGNVEISLVVDVSTSMTWCLDGSRTCATNSTAGDTRIEALREAAALFVKTVFRAEWEKVTDPSQPSQLIDHLKPTVGPEQISVSLVPYAQQVNLGPVLGPEFSFSNEHNESWCADFKEIDYAYTGIAPNDPLRRTLNADARNSGRTPSYRECSTDASRYVVPLSNDPDYLTKRVMALPATGLGGSDTAYTSIDIGAKWGAAFLDPTLQPVTSSLVSKGVVPAALATRPEAFRSRMGRKLLVLMTDGENTNTFAVNPPYRSGPAPNTVVGKNGKIYIYRPERDGSNDFYGESSSRTSLDWRSIADIGGSYREATYADVYANHTVEYYFSRMYRAAMGGNDLTGAAITEFGTAQKDVQLDSICAAAKNAGVFVWTIALGLSGADMATEPRSNWSPLQKCASVPAMYFEPKTAEELKEAFEEIAAAASELRLTQ
ncbi:Tad domain-containing protein [Ostreiculturibacter nitratireducens]|uniref:TadE/TadG family type IV pilus assembly protein n=1 Tax=Ostreiculturibacter nitratireducens TaxID=3075226 RepID=UPI0031B5A1CB